MWHFLGNCQERNSLQKPILSDTRFWGRVSFIGTKAAKKNWRMRKKPNYYQSSPSSGSKVGNLMMAKSTSKALQIIECWQRLFFSLLPYIIFSRKEWLRTFPERTSCWVDLRLILPGFLKSFWMLSNSSNARYTFKRAEKYPKGEKLQKISWKCVQ